MQVTSASGQANLAHTGNNTKKFAVSNQVTGNLLLALACLLALNKRAINDIPLSKQAKQFKQSAKFIEIGNIP